MNKKRKVKKVFLTIFFVFIGIIVIFCGTVFALKMYGEKNASKKQPVTVNTVPEEAEVAYDGKTVVYNGKTYHYNENIINILCMGVDKSISEMEDDSIGENGQADVLILMSLNTVNGELTMINIPRDTLTDVSKYNVNGEYTGVEKMQLCLAYAYGDGKESSCENVTEAVTRLMYGMPIHNYAAIDYDAISLLNDAVGGVTLELLEDMKFGAKGTTVHLSGNQAHQYVRTRDKENVDANLYRMERQKQYLNAFINTALDATREDISVPLDLYNELSGYMVTDLSASSVVYMASEVLDSGVNSINSLTVPGEMQRGEKYAEYIIDDTKLYEMVLGVFFEEKLE